MPSSQAVDRMLLEDIRELACSRVRPLQRLVREPVRLVDVLAQTNHLQLARHDFRHTVLIDASHLESNGVRAAVDA